MSSSAKRSGVWKYFVEVDKNKSKCNLCGVQLSRGGMGKTATTSSMKRHLQTKHKSEYEEVFGTTSIASSSKEFVSQSSQSQVSGFLKQPSLEDMLEKKKLWDINDSRAKRCHYLIGEMIAVDNEPFSIVESHVGFRRFVNNILPQYEIPSRIYFSENVIPDIYNKVVNNIKSRLAPVNHISFTTDMWTCQTNKTCFLSCTAHWLEESYMLGHAVLDIKVFPESHTAENIKKSLLDSVSDWNIPATKVRAVVHDNAANITKGVKDANFPSFRCFIHTLQLVINDAIDANTSVKETISAARRIVTHFNHSGYNKLHEIQEELGLPKKKLHQDVITRWNSTYYLLERIIEQRRAISVYFAESRNLNFENLSSDQWEIVLQLIILLKPFEEVTKITSSTYSPISDVIPHAVTLMRYLRKEELSEKTYQVDDFRNALPDITQKLTERIDDLKQKIAAWGKRIRRFSERSRRFNQNRLFQSDQKRLYKLLERPEVCGAGPGPDQADTVAFWRGLWSEPVNHSECPWMEVVASQSASVTSMDPVTITPEDVAEAVHRAPNWKSPGLDGLHHHWLKGFVVCHAVLARQFQVALDQKSLPSLFTTGITHLVSKDQDTTEQIPSHHVSTHHI
ncbi:unnamed protein product [Parnassius apollo]|uniref:(apollo) hypothetical protein n=1 Tax=Parnassius apollo TaxID=110799 RepID=A0A8S3WE82_PARAO|nr:unnamed protein product [Parnassius apollo]